MVDSAANALKILKEMFLIVGIKKKIKYCVIHANPRRRYLTMLCDQCQEDRDDVEECEDPYSLDISGESILMNLCETCYQDRVDDI
jgi:hypothetical protein